MQYYHRQVTLMLLAGAPPGRDPVRLLLDHEPQRAGEDEIATALRLLDRVIAAYPRAFDQAARAMTQVTGVAFVAVQNSYGQALPIRQGFVAFQTGVDVVDPLSQSVGIGQRMDSSHGVGTTGRLPQPLFPKAGPGGEFEGVQASHPGPEQHRRRFHHGRRGDTGLGPAIRNRRDHLPGEAEDLFGIGDQAAENG
ncbi:MAG: hypothetical protein HY238_08220 [Acidobacteria bacterium]|nr:hypothetical protein [Acidobacteriota bacterium]